MPSSLHRRIGQLALVGFDGFVDPARGPLARARVRPRRRHPLRRNVESPGAGGRGGLERARSWRATCRSGWASTRRAGASRGCGRPFTEWPPMATLGRAGRDDLAERVRARARGGTARPSASRSTSRRCSTCSPTRRTRSSATARWRTTPRPWRGSARSIIRGLQDGAGSPRAASTFPGTATRASTRTTSCRSSSTVARIGCGRSSFVPFRAAIAAGVHGHHDRRTCSCPRSTSSGRRRVSPAIVDRPAARGARVRRRGLHRRPRHEGDRAGLSTRAERAVVAAIAAGCDARLLVQHRHAAAHAAALEALVHAVEREEVPLQAGRGRLARQRRAKERFAASAPRVAGRRGRSARPRRSSARVAAAASPGRLRRDRRLRRAPARGRAR